jgi:hypothetical protein
MLNKTHADQARIWHCSIEAGLTLADDLPTTLLAAPLPGVLASARTGLAHIGGVFDRAGEKEQFSFGRPEGRLMQHDRVGLRRASSKPCRQMPRNNASEFFDGERVGIVLGRFSQVTELVLDLARIIALGSIGVKAMAKYR